MSRWRTVVRRELRRFQTQTGFDVVERQELLDQSLPVLEQEFPEADTPDQTLSRVLQELRDRDELEFMDYEGTYRILDLEDIPESETVETGNEVEYTARTYQSTVQSRAMPTAFRKAVLSWYDGSCPVSCVDRDGLLDVAHILPWSEHPEGRTEPENVLVLDKTHHEAFDRALFTIDVNYRLCVSPELTTDSELLTRTLVDRHGTELAFDGPRTPSPANLRERNATLEWV